MEERRELRRKRRQRNQILAYAASFVILAVVAFLIVQGVRVFADKNDTQEVLQQATQVSSQESVQESVAESAPESTPDILEDLYASEEEIAPPTETPEPTPAPPTQEELMEQRIEEIIAGMPLTEKVAGLFILTPEGLTGVNTAIKAGDGTKKALEEYKVGGIIYMKKNIKSKEQITEMIALTQSYSKYPLFIAVDEEGGGVTRVAAAGLADKQPSPKEIGETGDPNKAYETGSNIGGYLKELGFNVNFAPVADLSNVEKSIMLDRSYGATAEEVTPYVLAMMQGLEEQGITACMKHFPGIGGTTADTHDGLVAITRTAEEMRAEELAVYKAGIDAGVQMIMLGHADVESLTGDKTSAVLSEVIVTDILRGELGFKGVIVTDALNMKAISEYYTSEQAAVMALKAGCDMIMMPENFLQAYAGVLNAVSEGKISEERINDSLRRIYRIKLADEFLTEGE